MKKSDTFIKSAIGKTIIYANDYENVEYEVFRALEEERYLTDDYTETQLELFANLNATTNVLTNISHCVDQNHTHPFLETKRSGECYMIVTTTYQFTINGEISRTTKTTISDVFYRNRKGKWEDKTIQFFDTILVTNNMSGLFSLATLLEYKYAKAKESLSEGQEIGLLHAQVRFHDNDTNEYVTIALVPQEKVELAGFSDEQIFYYADGLNEILELAAYDYDDHNPDIPISQSKEDFAITGLCGGFQVIEI